MRRCLPLLTVLASVLAAASPVRAQQEIAPGLFVLSAAGGNALVYVAPEGSFVVAPPSEDLLAAITSFVRTRPAPPVRWAIVISARDALEKGDGGWGSRGVNAVAHESIRYGMQGLTQRQATAGHHGGSLPDNFPAVGFSEVIQIAFGGEEIHAVHHPGFSDADASIHFEHASSMYFGGLFTNDGYPDIDIERGGSIDLLIENASLFLSLFGGAPHQIEPIVPGRGPVATLEDLRVYRDMLQAVRERVAALIAEGRSIEEAVAAKPTASYDARWGSGPITPDEFTRLVYRSLARQ